MKKENVTNLISYINKKIHNRSGSEILIVYSTGFMYKNLFFKAKNPKAVY